MSADPVRAIADAVLYEGYVLWPYRRSALKNPQRWTFGGVYPRAHSEPRHGDDPWKMRTQCLVEGGAGARVGGRRALPARRAAPGATTRRREPVDELRRRRRAPPDLGGGDRARDRRRRAALDELAAGRRPIAIAQAAREEPRAADAGRSCAAGRSSRACSSCPPSALAAGPAPRDRAGREHDAVAGRHARGRAAADVLLDAHRAARAAAARSSRSPIRPTRCAAAAETCENDGHVAGAGRRAAASATRCCPRRSSSQDHPRIAPESPGDLFDGGEIDQLLTPQHPRPHRRRRRPRCAPPIRARARSSSAPRRLTPEELMRLHGTIRDVRAGSRRRRVARLGRRSEGRAPRAGRGRRRRGRARQPRAAAPARARRRLRPRARRAGRRSSSRSSRTSEGARAARGRASRTTPAATSASMRQPGHRFFFGRDEVEPLGDAPPAATGPRVLVAGHRQRVPRRRRLRRRGRAAAGASASCRRAWRSPTSASAAWTSPTRCRRTTTRSCCVDARAARRRAAGHAVRDRARARGRRGAPSTRTGWTR